MEPAKCQVFRAVQLDQRVFQQGKDDLAFLEILGRQQDEVLGFHVHHKLTWHIHFFKQIENIKTGVFHKFVDQPPAREQGSGLAIE